jgi:WASH complex subunit 7
MYILSRNNISDIIKMLTSVFTTELRNLEKFSHLRHFFMIVPALTINYIDHIFVCRSRLEKQRGDADCGATFVDDGFSAG